MNIQEAINLLKENKINIRIGMGILEDVKLGTSLSEAIELAIKALEKQIQKKPLLEQYMPARCPFCGEKLSEDGDGYYEHKTNKKICDCGQKLD